jgi:hypothetical protein
MLGPLPTGGIRVGLKRFNSQLGSELAGYAGQHLTTSRTRSTWDFAEGPGPWYRPSALLSHAAVIQLHQVGSHPY